MKKIFKYTLNICDQQDFYLPKGAVILSVQNQRADIQMWVLLDPDQETTLRRIKIFGTGHEVKSERSLDYIASVQAGAFVWHVFEEW